MVVRINLNLKVTLTLTLPLVCAANTEDQHWLHVYRRLRDYCKLIKGIFHLIPYNLYCVQSSQSHIRLQTTFMLCAEKKLFVSVDLQ